MHFNLATVLKLYTMYMHTGTTNLLPHGFGPPGAGKSWVVDKAAELLGVNVHVINVSRLSPLEVEGVQMPINGNKDLHFLTATFWTRIQEGDIVMFDEFLRGFPEVYNALLDIFTSRKVGSFTIPKSFWIGASNSVTTYDPALEDRLLHLPVPDIRRGKAARKQVAQVLIDETGLNPALLDSNAMDQLISRDIAPMYQLLDDLKAKKPATPVRGYSLRNLIGQIKLREFKSQALKDLIAENNALSAREPQFQIHSTVMDGKPFETLLQSTRITPLQRMNAQIHVDLAEMQVHLNETEEDNDDDIFD